MNNLNNSARHSRSDVLRPAIAGLTLLICLGACTGNQSEPITPDNVDPDPKSSGATTGGGSKPGVQAEVGALDEKAVKAVYAKAMGDVSACFVAGRKDVPFLAGSIEVFVRVAGDGSVNYAYPKASTLGHAATENCIIDAMKAQTWPKPEGGEEGQTTQTFDIEADARPPVEWAPADLGDAAYTLSDKLTACKSASGTKKISVTLYIDAEGNVMAAGASVGDEKGIDARTSCALAAVKGLSFPSPGSYPAKATISTP